MTTAPTNHNTDLGTSTEMAQLVDQIRMFDVEYATPAENMALAKALKLVAIDTVRQHEEAVSLRRKLEEHLTIAETTAELAGVIDVIRPKKRKRGWFGG